MKISRLRKRARRNIVVTNYMCKKYDGYVKLYKSTRTNAASFYQIKCTFTDKTKDELYKIAEYAYIMTYIKYKKKLSINGRWWKFWE